MKRGALSELAVPGAELAVKVKPVARRNAIDESAGELVVSVTAAPEGGKANEAVRALVADALGVAKTRLTLIRGATSRQKVFRID